MNKLKKLISSLLASVMILSLSAYTSFASVSQDVKNTEYENVSKVLGSLEIMVGDAQTGNFRPNDAIKRSESAKVAVTLLGLIKGAVSTGQVSKFPDVEKDYWANGFINTAADHRLVIGDDTGYFRPEDPIKFSEAVTILIRALGYDVQAMQKGGYPYGYISVASSIGLTKGVNSSPDKLISRGDVAKMAYNALTINLMEQTGYGSNVKYEITDKTILSDKLDITLIYGRVNAVGGYVLDEGSALTNNEIRIDNKNYSTKSASLKDVLGFNSDAYMDNKSKNIICVVPSEGKTNVLNIDADNIEKTENTLSSKSVYYYKDTVEKSVKAVLEKDAILMYNGKKDSDSNLKKPDSGYMSLLDTDLNGKYDIAFISETENYVVDEIYPSSNKITDKYGKPTLLMDFEDETKTIVLEKDNKNISLSDIKEWDVITLTMSKDKELIYGVVSNSFTEGKIDETDKDYVYVNGQKYKVAKNYPDILKNNDEGIFYIDAEGKIAGFKPSKASVSNYAYLENAAITSGISKVLKFELLLSDGNFETLEAADKISVNSSKNLSAQNALDMIGNKGQLITFEKNEDGKIKKINTALYSENINEDIFTLNTNESEAVFKESTSKLIGSDMSVSVTDNTVIFEILQNSDKSDHAIRDKKYFSDGGIYDISVYDVSENHRAGAIIVKNSNVKADEASSLALVEKISLTTNNKDENVYKLYAYKDGEYKSFVSKNESVFVKESGKLIGEGDIILFKEDSNGNIDKINVLFDSDMDNDEFKKAISENLTLLYGKVTKKFTDSVNVTVGNSSSENHEIKDSNIYLYDSKLPRNKIKSANLSDIEKYENNGGKVFMRIYKGDVKDIVIIK